MNERLKFESDSVCAKSECDASAYLPSFYTQKEVNIELAFADFVCIRLVAATVFSRSRANRISWVIILAERGHCVHTIFGDLKWELELLGSHRSLTERTKTEERKKIKYDRIAENERARIITMHVCKAKMVLLLVAPFVCTIYFTVTCRQFQTTSFDNAREALEIAGAHNTKRENALGDVSE